MFKNKIIVNNKYMKNIELKFKYFEKWYFKHNIGKLNICIIIGINENKNICFIQVEENFFKTSKYFEFDIKELTYTTNPFSIIIDNNFFSLEKIVLNLESSDYSISLDVKYSELEKVENNIFHSSIIKLFQYIGKLEYNLEVISMMNNIKGFAKINNELIDLYDGIRIYRKKVWN